MSKQWLAVYVDGESHAIPVDDSMLHTESVHCACAPLLFEGVIVHHSRDGREYDEPNFRPELNRKVN